MSEEQWQRPLRLGGRTGESGRRQGVTETEVRGIWRTQGLKEVGGGANAMLGKSSLL